MTDADIETIERATIAAVAPPAVDEIEGWLLPFDGGTVGRARSAVPLNHREPAIDAVADIEARYRAHGHAAQWRLPEAATFDPFRRELEMRGYAQAKPTLVMTAQAADVARASAAAPADLAPAADEDWASVFLGEGFDPVDGANRVQTLRRARGSRFGSVRLGGAVAAAGVLALGHGWASVHGMRTALTHRGEGLATRILSTFARTAIDHGYERIVLQVERDNPARRLYERCGFAPAWTYWYWQKPPGK